MADQTVIKLTGVDNVLRLLKALPPEVVSKRGGPAKTALRKGANVIAKQMRANLTAVTAGDETTGLLLKNLIVSRGKPPTSGKGERYLVRFRRKTYPGRKGKAVTTLKTAQLLEYGSSKQPAEPFIRPAFRSRAREAIDTVTRELATAVDRLATKYLKG